MVIMHARLVVAGVFGGLNVGVVTATTTTTIVMGTEPSTAVQQLAPEASQSLRRFFDSFSLLSWVLSGGRHFT